MDGFTVDPQCYTVALDGEESDLYPKEFDVLYLWMKYSDLGIFSQKQIYEAVWQGH